MTTYALHGIGYFFTHPKFWAVAICPLLLTIVFAIVSVVVLFATALHPQADALDDAGVPAVLAWLLAIILVVLEIFVATLIYSLVVLPCYMDKVFELVMIDKGYGDLVVNEDNHSSCCCSCLLSCRVSVCLRLMLLILTLPLNLIPIIGTFIYLWLNGALLAWEYHLYYFELKGYRYSDQKAMVDERKAQYSSFGMQALFLEMIPGVGPLFLFTNTVGAALFAADIEGDVRQSQAYWNSTNDPTLDHANSQTAAPPQFQNKGYHVV